MRRSASKAGGAARLAAAGLLAFLVPGSTHAGPPAGCVQVNTITLNNQREPAVAAKADGEFVVAWSSTTSYPAIYGRRFSAAGEPIDGTELRLNAFADEDSRLDPDVAYASDGGFVVTWQVMGGPGDDSSWSVWARRFAADATPLDGEEFLVNTITQGWQLDPRVAVLDDDSFVIVWENFSADVRARRYSAGGVPLDPVEFVVETAGGGPGRPAVERLPGTGFVVVWETHSAPGDSFVSVQARRFATDGTPLDADQFQVNTYTDLWQQNADVAVTASGGFTVAWASYGSWGSDDSAWSIQGRRYESSGVPVDAEELQLNRITLGSQRYPAVAALGGGFVAAWESFASAGGDDDPPSVQAARFAADGLPLDPLDFQVNCYTTGQQLRPVVAELPDGSAVVVWESTAAADDPDDRSVHLRVVRPAIFADGFESGDTSGWSSTVP
ncbi:MAG: hypothetical protein OES32_13685 [Acidobacteriota bacterium]|nr:hypothetical protein [Acidobacteriota bacterium]MDH3524630.1 hypothetical protein [Acidobacteriota bacterium]